MYIHISYIYNCTHNRYTYIHMISCKVLCSVLIILDSLWSPCLTEPVDDCCTPEPSLQKANQVEYSQFPSSAFLQLPSLTVSWCSSTNRLYHARGSPRAVPLHIVVSDVFLIPNRPSLSFPWKAFFPMRWQLWHLNSDQGQQKLEKCPWTALI